MADCPKCQKGFLNIEDSILDQTFTIREKIVRCWICGFRWSIEMELNRREFELGKKDHMPLLITGKNGRRTKHG